MQRNDVFGESISRCEAPTELTVITLSHKDWQDPAKRDAAFNSGKAIEITSFRPDFHASQINTPDNITERLTKASVLQTQCKLPVRASAHTCYKRLIGSCESTWNISWLRRRRRQRQGRKSASYCGHRNSRFATLCAKHKVFGGNGHGCELSGH